MRDKRRLGNLFTENTRPEMATPVTSPSRGSVPGTTEKHIWVQRSDGNQVTAADLNNESRKESESEEAWPSLAKSMGKDEQKVITKENTITNKVLGSGKKESTWSAIVGKEKMQRYELVSETIEGKETVCIPDEIFEDALPLWDDLLIGKFPSEAPSVGKVYNLLNRIWALGDSTVKIEIFVVDKQTLKFRVNNEGVRKGVVKRG